MSSSCKHCGVISRNPCSDYEGDNKFDGCYNLSEGQQLMELAAGGSDMARRVLELLEENERLKRGKP